MTTHALVPNKPLHPLVWGTGIAVIVFCLAGIAAVFGWIPGSLGKVADATAISTTGKPQAKVVSAANGKTPAPAAVCMNCGVILSIQEVVAGGEGSGMGAVGGAVVGGLLGHAVAAANKLRRSSAQWVVQSRATKSKSAWAAPKSRRLQ
jgi:uncharacterized protein YcfJ